jgi:hypothetical protein
LPADRDLDAARRAADELARRREAHRGDLSLVPDEPLPPDGTIGFRVQKYGMKTWGDLFTPRQALALTTFVACVRQLDSWGIGLIDCQVHTEHLERFGAYEVSRLHYLEMLRVALDQPTKRGKWSFELDFDVFAMSAGGATAPG